MDQFFKEKFLDWLRPVQDPEMFMSLVDLGLIYDVVSTPEMSLTIRMTLTSPGCPAADELLRKVKERAMEFEGVKSVNVELVWEPKWNPATMASDEVKDRMGIW